jgi:hypothetical protein
MAYSTGTLGSVGCVILLVFGVAIVVLLSAWQAEPAWRDATAQEVRQVAAGCDVVVTRFGPISSRAAHPDLPKVTTTIVVESHEEFNTKANCLYLGLKALGAASFIGDGDGRSLLISGLR